METYTNLALKYLEALVNISSKSDDFIGVEKCITEIEKFVSDLPITIERIKTDNAPDFLVMRSKHHDKGKPAIILSGHIDTVLSASEYKEKDRYVYGSGTKDMKGGIATILTILSILNKKDLLKNIIVAISPEEEVATPNHRGAIMDLAQEADYAMVFEFHSTQRSDRDFPRNYWEIITARKGAIVYRIDIKGPGGHSGEISNQTDRKTTSIPLAEIILGLEDMADYKKETTLNAGIINCGTAVNIIAKECQIVGDARSWTNKEKERIVDSISKLIDTQSKKYPDLEFSFNIIGEFPPLVPNENTMSFVEIIKKNGKELNIRINPTKQASSSEANFFSAGNPKIAIVDGLGLWGYDEHRETECASIESLENSVKLGTKIIESLLQ